MFKGIFSKERIVLGTLILVLLVTISIILFRLPITSIKLEFAQKLFASVQRSLNPSTANIILDKSDLKIRFKIVTADSSSFASFLKNLEIDNMDTPEIDIKLGDSSAEFLNNLFLKNHLTSGDTTEVNLNMRILAKEIDFDNKKIFGPFDSTENLLENPSDTGNMNTQILGENSYLITIDNPEKVLTEGTQSGNLKLSEHLVDSGWWQKLAKVAKIKLRVEDGSLTGAVFLK